MNSRLLYIVSLSVLIAAQSFAAAMDGLTVYTQRCAVCHDNAADRTPPRLRLRAMTPEQIVAALTTGNMQTQAQGLNPDEIKNVAEFLTARRIGDVANVPQPNACDKARPLNSKAVAWNGWGVDVANTRYQPNPGLAAVDVPRLKVKWTYSYYGQSAI